MFACRNRFLFVACLTLASGLPGLSQSPTNTGAKAPPKASRVATDRYGDPLPDGALARMGTMRWRLRSEERALGFTPDGKGLIVQPGGNAADTLRVLALTTGKVSLRLRVKNPEAYDISLATHKGLLAASFAGKVVLWEMPTGRLLREFEAAPYQVFIALSPDGKVLATGAGNGYQKGATYPIRLWDVATGQALGSLKGHATMITALTFSADGKRLLSSSPEVRWGLKGGGVEIVPGSVRVWDVATRKLLAQYANDSYSLVFAPDGRTWASLGKDNRIYLTDAATGKELARIATEMRDYTFTSDGKALAIASNGQPIVLWDAATGKELRRLEGILGDGFPKLYFAPDGKTLACANQANWAMPGGTVRLWDMATGKEIRSYSVHQEAAICAAYAPDGKTVASGGKDGSLFLWEAATGKAFHRLTNHTDAVTAVAFGRDGRLLASGSADRTVCLWRVADGTLVRQLAGPGSAIVTLTFSADGKTLWACDAKGKLRAWDVASGAGVGQTDLPANLLQAATFSPDGSLFAYIGNPFGPGMGFSGSKVHVCRTSSGKELTTFDPLKMVLARKDELGLVAVHCWAVALSADGRLLATSESLQTRGLRIIMSNHTVRVWELATGKQVMQLNGLAVPTRQMAFSPDGRLFAHSHGRMMGWAHGSERVLVLRDLSAGKDLQQKVTDKDEIICLQSGGKLRLLEGHNGGVTCLAFAPDGKTILSGGVEGTLLTWPTAAFAPGKPSQPVKLSEKEMQLLWQRLAGNDAALAYQAIGRLERAPDQAIPFVKEHLKPAPGVDLKRVAKLIAALEAKSYAVRQKAFNELAGYADRVEDALRKAMPRQRSLETQRRLQQLLDRLDKIVISPEHLRTLRALTILERIGTREARQVLERLAGAAPGTRLTREAQTTLERMTRRQAINRLSGL